MWEKADSRTFYPAAERKTVKKLKPGYYKIGFDNQVNKYFLFKKDIITDEILDLPIETGEAIVDDIKKFWEMKDRYAKYNLIHKRGMLMYGPGGSGKTSILNQLIRMLINDYSGIVFSIEDTDDLNYYASFCETFRTIEPKRPLIVIIEDMDGLLDGGRNVEKRLLNILDGINQIENVAYVATTNYPEKMEARLTNRPGRFDRRFHIGYPKANVRKAFFEAKMHPDDKGVIDLKEMVKQTAELTIAHCKEVFTEHVIKGRKLEEVVKEMKNMNENKIHSDNDKPKKGVGFSGTSSWEDGFDDLKWVGESGE
jgi:SpoVK/Ycf46/Vps4 family AAA+-type ATPase